MKLNEIKTRKITIINTKRLVNALKNTNWDFWSLKKMMLKTPTTNGIPYTSLLINLSHYLQIKYLQIFYQKIE